MLETIKEIISFIVKYKLETLFFMICLFHYRIYYKLGICANIYAEVFLGLVALFVIRRAVRKTFKEKNLSLQSKLSMFGVSAVYIFACTLFGIKSVERFDTFLDRARQEYGTIYSAKMLGWQSSRYGTRAKVSMLDDTTKIFDLSCKTPPKEYCLYIFPELGHCNETGYFSVYPKSIIEYNPTKVQLDYCIKGEKSAEKVANLKKYTGVISKENYIDYLKKYNNHDNRIISAVVEKRGSKYVYLNATQSKDKIWAILDSNQAKDGQKVLVSYDAKSPSLFFVINWNPTEKEYEEYGTADGKAPSQKYLLFMEKVSGVNHEKIKCITGITPSP